jgi:hypothetical protein
MRSEMQCKKSAAGRAARPDLRGIGVAACDQMIEYLGETLVRLRHKVDALLAPIPPTRQTYGFILPVLFAMAGKVHRHTQITVIAESRTRLAKIRVAQSAVDRAG